MSTENKSFHSAAGPWFWQAPDPSVKARIQDKIISESKKGLKTAVFFIVISVIVFVYGLFMKSSGFFGSFEKYLCITMPFVMLYLMVSSAVSTSRYLRKAKEGRFYCRHVVIEDMKMTTNGLTNRLVVWIRSDDERLDQASVDMEVYARNRINIGEHGMFVMIEDEQRKAMVSPFWFITDMDLRDPYEDS